MLEADALARLQSYTDYAIDPVLTSAELTALLEDNRVRDADGRLPDDANWEGAWNLAQAASEGWLIKAGKVAARFNFRSDVSGFDRRQIHEMCLQISAAYAAQSGLTSISVIGAYIYDPVIGNYNGAP